jgi:hypothetical protein
LGAHLADLEYDAEPWVQVRVSVPAGTGYPEEKEGTDRPFRTQDAEPVAALTFHSAVHWLDVVLAREETSLNDATEMSGRGAEQEASAP